MRDQARWKVSASHLWGWVGGESQHDLGVAAETAETKQLHLQALQVTGWRSVLLPSQQP